MTSDPIDIDGSHGEGGGQILRSSLALSLVTGQPIRVRQIRAGRRRPGLMRQHLTAVLAATEISNAETNGATIGSKELTFTPQTAEPGIYHFQVGTAGSAMLVLQTVLPGLMCTERPSTLTIEGGTHNPWAPPFEFLKHVYLPLLRRMGPSVELTLDTYGFHPAGGGSIRVDIQPAPQLQPLSLVDSDAIHKITVRGLVANLPARIGQREIDYIKHRTDWDPSHFRVDVVKNSPGPGNCVQISIERESLTELFTGFGRIGVQAEHVARDTLKEARAYLAADIPVGPYLADQLMLPLGLSAWQGHGGGEFLTGPLTRHAHTHQTLLEQFLNISVQASQSDERRTFIKVC